MEKKVESAWLWLGRIDLVAGRREERGSSFYVSISRKYILATEARLVAKHVGTLGDYHVDMTWMMKSLVWQYCRLIVGSIGSIAATIS